MQSSEREFPNRHQESVTCFKGFSSQIAWDLHQEFKREIIARLPYEGGTIKVKTIDTWLINNQI